MGDGNGDIGELDIKGIRRFVASSLFREGIKHLFPEGFTEVSSTVMPDGGIEVDISDETGRAFKATIKVEEVAMAPVNAWAGMPLPK